MDDNDGDRQDLRRTGPRDGYALDDFVVDEEEEEEDDDDDEEEEEEEGEEEDDEDDADADADAAAGGGAAAASSAAADKLVAKQTSKGPAAEACSRASFSRSGASDAQSPAKSTFTIV